MTKCIRVAVGLLLLVIATNLLAQGKRAETIGSRQYKRVHQNLLDQITDGKIGEATMRLQQVAADYPDDAETQYMLAIALAQSGKRQAAIDATRRALDAGRPPGRFLAGPRDLLQSLSFPSQISTASS